MRKLSPDLNDDQKDALAAECAPHLPAAGSAASLPAIDWSKVFAVLIAFLQALGVVLPPNPTVADAKAATLAAGFNWGKLLAAILAALKTFAGP